MSNLAKKQETAIKCQRVSLWLNYIICTMFAGVSFICCGFQINYTMGVKVKDDDSDGLFQSVVDQI